MIEFTRSYKTSDGNVFASLPLAQAHELTAIIKEDITGEDREVTTKVAMEVASLIVNHHKRVIDILTTTERSHPKGRSINGAVRKRNKSAEPDFALAKK